MKHLIFKILVICWNLCPYKIRLSRIINKNNWLKEKIYRDLRYKGIMNIRVGNQNINLYNPGFTTIENELFWNGLNNGWEKISLKLWQQLVLDAETILDIGANSGIYTFVASKLNPRATIYAFEPVNRTAEIFKKNLKLNQNSKIKLIQKAVSNNNGNAIFYDLSTESQYSASLNENMLKNYSNRISYEVDVIGLDSFTELSDKKIDLIKIDVEMHEPEAIQGMLNIIKRDKPSMLIEVLNDEIGEKIESQISDIGYLYFTIDEVTFPKKMDKLEKSECYNFLICTKERALKMNLIKNE